MGLWDLTLKRLLRACPDDLLSLLPGVRHGRPLRLLDKEFPPPVALPRALDGCVEVAEPGEDGTVLHVEFEAEPRSDTGRRVFEHCVLAHLGLGRPIRPVVFYLSPAPDGRRPLAGYGWAADDRDVLLLRFETVCLWELSAADLLARAVPALWTLTGLCGGALPADVGRALRQIAAAVPDARTRRELEAVTLILARRRFAAQDLSELVPSEVLMESESAMLQDLFPELFDRVRRDGQAEGKAEGKAEGRAEGKAEGRAEALLAVFAARGLAATDEERARVLACGDLATLERWIRQAVTAASVAEALA
jgi:hypothetical protein